MTLPDIIVRAQTAAIVPTETFILSRLDLHDLIIYEVPAVTLQ